MGKGGKTMTADEFIARMRGWNARLRRRGDTVATATAGTRGPRRVIVTTVSVAATLVIGACSAGGGSAGGTAAGGKEPAVVSMMLDWFPNPDHIALYLAQRNGDFTAQGLRVTFESPSDTTDALKLVSLDKVDLAISYEPTVIDSAADPAYDVTAVAALIPTALDTLIISGKAGIANPGDLAGKTVGTSGDAESSAIYKLILSRYGLSPARTNLVTVNEGLIPAMISGKVQAIIGGYRNVEAVQLRSEGLDPKVYPVTEEGVPTYDELVIVANKSKLASDASYRAMVRGFLAGLAKGTAAAQASPAAAEAALGPVAKGYSPPLLRQMVDDTVPLLANPAGFGAMTATAWQSFATWMYGAGLITKPVNIAKAGLVNTSLLPRR
jgi:putative hydroxymethylpyrimidine transport system substrate-binding protein